MKCTLCTKEEPHHSCRLGVDLWWKVVYMRRILRSPHLKHFSILLQHTVTQEVKEAIVAYNEHKEDR